MIFNTSTAYCALGVAELQGTSETAHSSYNFENISLFARMTATATQNTIALLFAHAVYVKTQILNITSYSTYTSVSAQTQMQLG